MNCEIKRNGYLFLYAETEIEAYALNRWCDENFPILPENSNAPQREIPKIVFNSRLPHERKENET